MVVSSGPLIVVGRRRVLDLDEPSREVGDQIVVDVLTPRDDELTAVVLTERALPKVVDATRGRVVVVKEHHRDRHAGAAGVVLVPELELAGRRPASLLLLVLAVGTLGLVRTKAESSSAIWRREACRSAALPRRSSRAAAR